jgi:hypothetical protein
MKSSLYDLIIKTKKSIIWVQNVLEELNLDNVDSIRLKIN